MINEKTNTAVIRLNSRRMWEYLKEMTNCLEQKLYLNEGYFLDELLGYCKSCEEDYKEIEKATYELEQELADYEKSINCIDWPTLTKVVEVISISPGPDTSFPEF